MPNANTTNHFSLPQLNGNLTCDMGPSRKISCLSSKWGKYFPNPNILKSGAN